MGNDNTINEILTYWNTIEFLGQNDYPYVAKKNGIKSKKYPILTGMHEIFKNSASLEEFYNNEELIKDYPEISANIEVCLGKVTRESCIQKIYQLSNNADKRIEMTKGNIAIFGMQITSLKRYVGGSFNLSPIIWLLYKLTTHKKENLVALVDEKEYKKDIQDIENYLKLKEEIDIFDLNECFQKVGEKFLIEAPFEGVIAYQRFKDDKTKEKFETMLGYSNLNMSFFSKDLDFVSNLINQEQQANHLSFIKSFISYAHDSQTQSYNHRINILEKNEASIALYKKVLHINNAPLAKWPSKFSPSFLQQFAINLSISKCFEKPMDYISVNGPPGTGKTTMLKEIIADSIVKKAIAMMKYNDPEEAFTEHEFNFGPKTKNGYHKWDTYNKYYSVSDEINKYSIIVASCNNAAVENITKELPDGKALCKGLTCENHLSANEKMLNEVNKLFSFESEDIFFSDYAKKFLDNDDVWGLISVPLGNRKNQGDFTKILNQIFYDLLSKTSSIQEHKQKYTESVLAMKKQLDIVNGLKKELKKYCNLESSLHEFIKKMDIEIKSQKNNKQKLKKEIVNLRAREEDTKKKIESFKGDLEKADSEYLEYQNIKLNIQNKIVDSESMQENLEEAITKLEDSRTLKDFIFRIFHIETMKEQKIKEKYNELNRKKENIKSFTNDYEDILMLLQNKEAVTKKIKKNIQNNKHEIEKNQKQMLKSTKALETANSVILMKAKEKEKAKQEFLEIIKKLYKTNDFNSFDVLNDDFFEKLFSEDIANSTKAHLRNPWISEHYNREREKLFFYGLQVIKEFTLSSSPIRTNIKNLLMIWMHSDGEDSVTYDERDRFAAFPSLLQSLLVFIPVISTTFASVSRFFEDYAQNFTLGTLIIDEAGQAQPHMALGLLARCRKAIIVGDPKQVEPVVKGDLDAIKQLIKTEIRAPYMNKHLSVQEFADGLNRFGTIYENKDGKTWVGCPLVVHRRCISPMFEISNKLSYNDVMKQQTLNPSVQAEAKFAIAYSHWEEICGKEKSSLMKNHYVKEQGEYVVKIVHKAFSLAIGKVPSLYVISPFTSVVDELKKEIRSSEFYKRNKSDAIEEWLEKNCGTVHTFQGKEADEVIFLLGCDRDAIPAIKWVNNNIINVAVTRAKFRICVVGDYQAWKNNESMKIAKGILDGFAIKKVEELNKEGTLKENNMEEFRHFLPSKNSFINEWNETDTEIDTENFVSGLKSAGYDLTELSTNELASINLKKEDFNKLSLDVKRHLVAANKIDQVIRNFEENFNISVHDRSVTNVLFCKAFEQHLRDCFIKGLKRQFPNFKINKKTVVLKLKDKDFMIGKVKNVLSANKIECISICKDTVYTEIWWNQFLKNLEEMGKKRNNCCHCEVFTYDDEAEFRNLLFKEGVFINSKVGKVLESKEKVRN